MFHPVPPDGTIISSGGRQLADVFLIKLAETLSARLCHELVSPIGAISNGVEILEEEPDFAASAAQLIGQSSLQAARRLQFYRVAYGSTAELADKVARNATQDLFLDGKINLEWPPSLPQMQPGWGKLACNMLLLASEALPRGGQLELMLRQSSRGETLMATVATGQGARLHDPLPLLLDGEGNVEDLTPRTVQAAFTHALADRLGLHIRLKNDVADEIALLALPN